MRTLFIDCETTGVIEPYMAPEDPRQPHLCQFAAILRDGQREVSRIDLVVNPGVEIPEGAARVHGITTDIARLGGVPETAIVGLAFRLAEKADLVVAHNFEFDWQVILIAAIRSQFKRFPQHVPSRCTMVAATPIMQLPPTQRMLDAGFNKYKTPNLAEAFEFFAGRKLEGAHNAAADVRACMAVHDALEARGVWKEAA
jgi:DNA polymerase-3 subunit epsilon